MRPARRLLAAAIAAALATSLAACAQSAREGGEGGGAGATGGTLVFGAPGAPDMFDPIFAQDGENFRPARQMFDTLITYEQGSAELAPGLATSWTPSENGTVWTFKLREGVRFHDGTPFNAEAVCFNFNRWFNLPNAAAQSQAVYYSDIVRGLRQQPDRGRRRAGLQLLQRARPEHRGDPAQPGQGRVPCRLRPDLAVDLQPDRAAAVQRRPARAERRGVHLRSYANEHPTGTGPFKFESYDRTANNTSRWCATTTTGARRPSSTG